jgi:hypothetical protein
MSHRWMPALTKYRINVVHDVKPDITGTEEDFGNDHRHVIEGI